MTISRIPAERNTATDDGFYEGTDDWPTTVLRLPTSSQKRTPALFSRRIAASATRIVTANALRPEPALRFEWRCCLLLWGYGSAIPPALHTQRIWLREKLTAVFHLPLPESSDCSLWPNLLHLEGRSLRILSPVTSKNKFSELI